MLILRVRIIFAIKNLLHLHCLECHRIVYKVGPFLDLPLDPSVHKVSCYDTSTYDFLKETLAQSKNTNCLSIIN